MSLTSLSTMKLIFLDTAPIIYYVEGNPYYDQSTKMLFDLIDTGKIMAITSLLTLSECLVMPFRKGLNQLIGNYHELFTAGQNLYLSLLDDQIAITAAKIRAQNLSLKLPDAIQLATTIKYQCDSFVTNDARLTNVVGLPTALNFLCLNELENELQNPSPGVSLELPKDCL